MDAITISVAALIISILSFTYVVYTGAIECYFKTIQRKQTAAYKLFRASFILSESFPAETNEGYLSQFPEEHIQMLSKMIKVATEIANIRKRLNELNPLLCFAVPFAKIGTARTMIEDDVPSIVGG